ncbi:MAG: head GIN domain-containing protein [Thermodesulfobacteriota bacterium]
MKNHRPLEGLLLVLMLILAAAPASGATSGCTEGNGKISSETRNLPSFTGIAIDGAFDLRITCGKPQSVKVTADSNLLPFITTRVDAAVLTIDTNRSICTKSDLLVTVTLPDIQQVEVGGSTDMVITGIANRRFNLTAEGASDISVSGKTGLFQVSLSGSTELKARQLLAETVQIKVLEASEATVHAIRKLEAVADGASSITYFGDPESVSRKAEDAAEISSGDGHGADDTDEEE